MAKKQTPTDLSFSARDMAYGGNANLVRWWFAGNPQATAFYNALSASFPMGERFFMDSVRRYRNVADPHLQEQITAFTAQEAIHSREHRLFNRQVAGQGYDFSRIDAFLKARFAWARSRPPIEQLAGTIALEHFTAILAHALLSDPRQLKGAPADIARLWRWHAIEEIEHKAVAFDTFLAATRGWSAVGRWALRCSVMVIATSMFFEFLLRSLAEFFRQDGILRLRTWLRFLRWVFVEPGILRRVLGSYFTYYVPGFHPWRVDDRGLITAAEPSLAAS